MDLENVAFAPRSTGPSGIGGWLVLPLIGLFITIGFLTISLTRDLVPVMFGPTWAMLTTPGTSAYHAYWAPYIVVSTISCVVMLAAAIALLVLALRKHPRFPMGMVIFYLALVPFSAIDLWAFSTFINEVSPGDVEATMPEVIRQFARSIVACLVWIPYFLTSKRVKNTFVR